MLKPYEKIAKQIKKTIGDFKPEVGIILGSGWNDVVSLVKNPVTIKYSSLSGMPKTSVKGHSGNLVFGELNNKNVVFVQGRFHIYEGHDISTTVLPVRMLKQLGVNKVILTNAAGGVNENYNVGDIVIVKDLINFTGKNPLIGIKPTEENPVFVDMTYPVNQKFSEIAYNICNENNIPVHYGTYFQLTGPTYETPAEIKMVRALGGDLVGMSTGVEVIMAAYEKMEVAVISCVTNKAAGMENKKLSHEEVLQATNNNRRNFLVLLENLISQI